MQRKKVAEKSNSKWQKSSRHRQRQDERQKKKTLAESGKLVPESSGWVFGVSRGRHRRFFTLKSRPRLVKRDSENGRKLEKEQERVKNCRKLGLHEPRVHTRKLISMM